MEVVFTKGPGRARETNGTSAVTSAPVKIVNPSVPDCGVAGSCVCLITLLLLQVSLHEN